jgi:uncharacterized protein (DUF1501 family)
VHTRNRREFLKGCCALGAAGMASQLTPLGMMTAHAQSPGPGYKALVCVFLFGGNDSNNMIIPIDSRYGAYQAMRGSVALAQSGLTATAAGSSGYAFHPSMANVARLYNLNRVATVFNVGTLVHPTTKATLGSTSLPRNLYSHSDQTQQWQSSDPSGGATGWGGRVNDLAAAMNSGTLPPGITVNGGNALFLAGNTTLGTNVSNLSSGGLRRFGDGTAMNNRLASLQRVLTFDSGLRLVSAANGVLGESIQSMQQINTALSSAPALPVTFPTSGLGQQLAQVARIMSVHGTLGMNRQIFFAGRGGFDNHENLVGAHAGLMNTLDAAVGAFFNCMEARGTMNEVTLFTESEFNRTGDANANVGTDHAWGSHQMVIGGAVNGGSYGTFPQHLLRGPDDAGDRGYWIPTTALDQYAATLGSWFGVSDVDLNSIFPNLVRFAPQRLGFV